MVNTKKCWAFWWMFIQSKYASSCKVLLHSLLSSRITSITTVGFMIQYIIIYLQLMGVILLIHPEIMTWWNLLTFGVQAHSLSPSRRFRLEPLNDTDHMFQWHHFNPVYGLIKKLPWPIFPQDKWWFIAKFVWAAPVSRCCYSHGFWGSVDWTDNWNPIFFGMNLETSHWNWTWSPRNGCWSV